MGSYTLYHNISELLTLEGARTKSARKTIASDLSIIVDGAIICENKRIKWVGKRNEIPSKIKRLCHKKVDLKGHCVLPGFVDCHTHSLFGGTRSHEFELRNQGATYQEIASQGGGIVSTVRQTRESSDKELLFRLKQNVSNFVSQGVTSLEIKSGYGLNHKEEIRLLKLIKKIKQIDCISTFLGPHARSPEEPDYQKYIDQIISKTLPEIKRQKLSHRVDIFIDEGYFNIEQGKNYWSAAKSLGFDIVVHADQLTRTGAGVEAARMGALSVDHLIQIYENDIKELARSETTCVLLPTADLYLKMPYPPARRLIDSGARVALATDFNPGSSPSLDISLVGVLARINMGMTLPECIVAYTLGAAFALGLQNEVGSLTVGKLANFVVLDVGWKDLFYQVGFMPLRSVWSKNQKIFEKKFAF